jgi:hypothetical protein
VLQLSIKINFITATTNPNQCPTVGTFFVQKTNTDMNVVRQLADNGHEIGVTTIDGTSPQTEQQWKNNLLRKIFYLLLVRGES